MKKFTKLSLPWFYELLERGECDVMDFKQQIDEKEVFGKSIKNYSNSYEELSKDVVAFANKKGGFLFIGIEDKTKDFNPEFKYDEGKLSDLINNIQDRTQPSITVAPHKLNVNGNEVVVLEIPFMQCLCSTSKGEYLIRDGNRNRPIKPLEMLTIASEKGSIIYDQKTWRIKQWEDENRVNKLKGLISKANPDSPYLKDNIDDFNDTLSFVKEEINETLPTTTGILFTGTNRALKEFPYATIKYVRYFNDGTYRPYEWNGNLIEVADGCFNQLKAEIQQVEFNFGLFHETIEDYSEIVLREVLINAIAHRDYSRQQIIQIRKYSDYIEFESPGLFPDGITPENFLWKTNPRNPNIIDIFRIIKYAEKAGSGWDKVFIDLLSKGKPIPHAEETDSSVIFRIDASIVSPKLIELSRKYQQHSTKQLKPGELLILNELLNNKGCTFNQLENIKYIDKRQIHYALKLLLDADLIEATGRGYGTKYILHKKHNTSVKDKILYAKQKKQNKSRQKEAILRYLDSNDTITNSEARALLELPYKAISQVSRLLSTLLKEEEIEIDPSSKSNKPVYRRKKR